MLDHVLLEVIAGIRRAFEAALLERQASEERFQSDVFGGDLSWESSWNLPGEGFPPRARADVALDWPTWSQSAYRSWALGEPGEDPPELGLEVVLRVQRLTERPDPSQVLGSLSDPPSLGADPLERSGPMVEEAYGADPGAPAFAVEVAFDGGLRLEDAILENRAALEGTWAALAAWVASALVRLGDLELAFLPPEGDEESMGLP